MVDDFIRVRVWLEHKGACDDEAILELPADSSDEEIATEVREWAMERVTWGYRTDRYGLVIEKPRE